MSHALEVDREEGMEGSEWERKARTEITSLFFSCTSRSPSLPFQLPYPTRVDPFGTIQVEKGVGNEGKERKRGKRRRRTSVCDM